MTIMREPTVPIKAVIPRVPGQPTWFDRRKGWILGGVSVVGLLVIWQVFVGVLGLASPLILPPPLRIAERLGELLASSAFWYDMQVSGIELGVGFGLAIVVGLILGLVMGWFKALEQIADPIVNFFNNTPRIALAPLFIIWFGIGIESKIAFVFFGAVFPIVITTVTGVKNLDRQLLRAARSFGANNMQLFRTVALPGAVPYIISGLRLAIAHAVAGVVIGEFVAAQAGIGVRIVRAGQVYDTATVFACVIVVAVVGMLLTGILALLERRFQTWKPVNK